MVKLKPGVTWDGLQPEGQWIREVLEAVSAERGIDLTITCTTKEHGPSDPHTAGFAVDVRTLDLTHDQILTVYRATWQKLGTERYTVLFEATPEQFKTLPPLLQDIASINSHATTMHLHIQYKKGLWQTVLAARQHMTGEIT